MLVDTHCHLADPAFDADREAVLARAREAGVGHVVAVGENRARSEQAADLARRHAGVSATAGIHPHEASAWSPEAAAWLAVALRDPVVVAAGEMGLDYHYDLAPRNRQREAFEAQMALAAEAGRPAVIHAREADDDVAAVLLNHPRTVAILHSFSSGPGLLRAGVALGHYVSWSGMITFRRWDAESLVREVPADRLLVETDAPYLAPVPHRGHRNEPAYVAETAARLAGVLGLPVEEVVSLTTANAARVFGARVTAAM
ncbi:MAG TPA: TatD family hydrolase [Gemmatimonadales bacterium]